MIGAAVATALLACDAKPLSDDAASGGPKGGRSGEGAPRLLEGAMGEASEGRLPKRRLFVTLQIMFPPTCTLCQRSFGSDLPRMARIAPSHPLARFAGDCMHRECFDVWPLRYDFTRAHFEALVHELGDYAMYVGERDVSEPLYLDDVLVARICVADPANARDTSRVMVRHVRAFEGTWGTIDEWTEWIVAGRAWRKREPTRWTWSGHPDDEALFSEGMPRLRAAFPNTDAILESANYRAINAGA